MELVAALAIAALVVQQVLHNRERATLLDRLQAPEQVIAYRAPEPSGDVLHLALDDDEAAEEYETSLRNGEVT